MKLLLSSLAILASSVSTAAPVPSMQAAAPLAVSTSPERLDLARKFVALALPPERYTELMRTGASSGLSETLAAAGAEDDQPEAEEYLNDYFARIQPVVQAQLPLLSEAYAAAYAKEYSETELQQMIGFAQTPAGRHYFARHDFVDLDPAVLKAQVEIFKAIAPVMQQMQKEKCAEKAAQRFAAGDRKAKCPLGDKPETLAG